MTEDLIACKLLLVEFVSSITNTKKVMTAFTALMNSFMFSCENFPLYSMCLTRLANESVVVVFGKCPYVTFSKMQVLQDNLLFHLDFVIHLFGKVCSVLSAMKSMFQQCMRLITSV